jgi:hypothetical protein
MLAPFRLEEGRRRKGRGDREEMVGRCTMYIRKP